MSRFDPEAMTADQLVDRFLTIALAQDDALLMNDTVAYTRLYEEMDAVRNELKRRPGDQRRGLVRLYSHPNAQVRLKAAITTLAVTPQAARHTLQVISDRNEYPQAADARGMLRALHEGTYVPS
jgi:Domain of unknown function (DUF2019)